MVHEVGQKRTAAHNLPPSAPRVSLITTTKR